MGEQLSILDTMFLDLEQVDASAHMHIGAALIFEGEAPDVVAVRARIADRIGLLPRFAQRLSAPHAGPMTWLTWEQAEQLDLGVHVRHATLPEPGDEQELRDWLADFWSHRLDRTLPLWELVLLDGLADDRWAVVTKVHHCLVDGVGSLDTGALLLDLDLGEAVPAPVAPAPAEHGDHGHFWLTPRHVARGARAGLGLALHPRDALHRARAAAEVIIKDDIIAAPETSLNGPMSGTRRYTTVHLDLDEVKAVRRRLGGTVNDLVLTLCAGGLRDLLVARGEMPPSQGLRVQVPVNIRSTDREHALGNELTSLFVELPVDVPDTLELHQRVIERAQESKDSAQREGGKAIIGVAELGPPIAGALVARSMFGRSRVFNLTITNVPGPQERLSAFGAPLVDVQPLVPLFAGHALGIAIISYAGELVFGLNADRLAVPDLDVLAEAIEDSFAELRQAVPSAREAVPA